MTEQLELPGVERPQTRPEYGAKTAQAVLDLIRLHPEMHDQGEWVWTPRIAAEMYSARGGTTMAREYLARCGTTMCIAGWTQWVHEGLVDEEVVDVVAREYLGISADDADTLFYSQDEVALRALEYVARGEPIDWDVARS